MRVNVTVSGAELATVLFELLRCSDILKIVCESFLKSETKCNVTLKSHI